jgi:hypothetical protein
VGVPYNSDFAARMLLAMVVLSCNSRGSVVLAKIPWDFVDMKDLHLSSRNLHWS